MSGGHNDLLNRLRVEPLFAKVDFDAVLNEDYFVGRTPEQVDEFISQEVQPIRERYRQLLGRRVETAV